MNLKKLWTNHLQENKMSYVEHLIFALWNGLFCILAGLYLIVHGILPCFLQTAGSDLVTKLNKTFKSR